MIAQPSQPWDALPEDTIRFLRAIGRGDLERVRVRGLHWKGKGGPAPQVADLHDAKLERWNGDGYSIYALLARAEGGDKAEHVTELVAVFIEWDDRPLAEQLAFDWEAFGFPAPPVQVTTGGKSLHCYWPLSEPCTDIPRWRRVMKRMIAAFKSDKSINDPARIMRLPGFRYWYSKKKAEVAGVEPGSQGGLAELVRCEPTTFSLDDLEAALNALEQQQAAAAGPAPQPAPQPTKVVDLPRQGDFPQDTLEDIQLALDCIPPRVPNTNTYEEYRNLLWGLRAALEKAGYDPAMAPALMAQHSPQWDDDDDLERIAEGANGSITEKTFWKMARDHGYRKRPERKAPGQGAVVAMPRPTPAVPTPPTDISQDAPDGIQVSDRPAEVVLAEQVFTPANGYASDGSRLYRYNPERGYWVALEDIPSKSLVLHWLKKCWTTRKDPHTKFPVQIWPWGTDRHITSAHNVILRNDPQPQLLTSHRRYLVFRDKTLDLKTWEAVEHNPEHWATSAIDADLVLSDDCPAPFQQFVERCYGPNLVELIRAVVRMCIDPTLPYEKAVFLLGETGTGKGTLLQFIQSLLPRGLRQSLDNPDQVAGPEKVYQYVKGRRLLAFADVTRPAADMSTIYSLIENAPVAVRRLHSSDTEELALGVRVLLASTRPIKLRDGNDGWQRRVITIPTLKKTRAHQEDTSVKGALVPENGQDTPDHAALRGAVAGWALAMDRADAIGLLRHGQQLIPELVDARNRTEVEGDVVSEFIDRCLEPAPGEGVDLGRIADAYYKFCALENHAPSWGGNQLKAAIRRALPDSHIPRRRGEGGMVPAQDHGYRLRPELFQGNDISRDGMGEGGLSAIRASLAGDDPEEGDDLPQAIATEAPEGGDAVEQPTDAPADPEPAAAPAPPAPGGRWSHLSKEQITAAKEVVAAAAETDDFHTIHDRLTAAGVLIPFPETPLFVPWIKGVA